MVSLGLFWGSKPLSNRHYNIIKHKPHDLNKIFFKNKLQFVSYLRNISYTFSTLIVVPLWFWQVWLVVCLFTFLFGKVNAKHNYLYYNNSKMNGIYTDYFLSLTNCYVLNIHQNIFLILVLSQVTGSKQVFVIVVWHNHEKAIWSINQ